MVELNDVAAWMDQVAPLALSEAWDNTGLLIGDRASRVERIQTCLTLTPESVDEAIAKQADLVIAHHPLPFKPLNKITTDSMVGKLVWQLASNRIAVYSPHTSWDSAPLGINQQLAQALKLDSVRAIVPNESGLEELAGLGSGRLGELPQPTKFSSVADALCKNIANCRPRAVLRPEPVRRVAICCGSGGSLLGAAIKEGCDLFVTGEATFHTCLEAQYHGIGLLMVGHYASERFAMEYLAKQIQDEFSSIECWASDDEHDPVCSLKGE